MPLVVPSLADNLAAVQAQIAEAALAAGRDPAGVRLVAVSKTKPVEALAEALAAGQLALGENRVQELVLKHETLADHDPKPEWHLIGHLQRNKAKYIVPFIHLIHSLDSLELLFEIERQAAKYERVVDCLIQLKISPEETKEGTDEAGARELLGELALCPHVRIVGLMGIAENTQDEAVVRAQFRTLRETMAALKAEFETPDTPQLALTELSMGMTQDYAWAIAEGATLVRIGSAIFGAR